MEIFILKFILTVVNVLMVLGVFACIAGFVMSVTCKNGYTCDGHMWYKHENGYIVDMGLIGEKDD